MTWLGWLWLALVLGSLYFLGLTLYKLVLSAKSLQAQAKIANATISKVLSVPMPNIEPARPNSQEDLAQLVQERRQREKAKAERKQARQRRLVARIRDIEIDKRFL